MLEWDHATDLKVQVPSARLVLAVMHANVAQLALLVEVVTDRACILVSAVPLHHMRMDCTKMVSTPLLKACENRL